MQWWLLRCLVFLGAFLLFTLEPFVGRSLIPQFGGSIHVWLVSLMFFQAMLFIGYAYAHLVARWIGKWHVLVAATPLLLLPIGLQHGVSERFAIAEQLTVLILNIGLPFSVLATTAVVVQTWIADSQVGQSNEPYSLYGASNAGSLLGLICYPFVVEPLSGLRIQSLIWTGMFFVYLAILYLGWRSLRPLAPRCSANSLDTDDTAILKLSDCLMWLLLSCLPSAYLLSVTNYIGAEVGSFPLIWVIPLALYLSSFIVTFRTNGGCPRILSSYTIEVVAVGLVLYLLPPANYLALTGHLAVFLGVCLITHGELYVRRPTPRFLTHFYLTIAAGGWLGGVAISLVAPQVFTGLYDYPVILVAVALLLFRCRRHELRRVYLDATLSAAAFRVLIIVPTVILICMTVFWFKKNEKYRHRNFYGTYRVVDIPANDHNPIAVRKLFHGSTLHGSQFLERESKSEPISYYHADGAIARAFHCTPSPRRVAVVGLGAGAISALASRDDQLTFYELDPDNERIARTWFTFLDDSLASVKVVSGDGRLRLRQSHELYDAIVLDAFTGDGIPTHLLTSEAFGEYMDRLAPDGIILLHISNRFYDLRPVIKSIAQHHSLHAIMNVVDSDRQRPRYRHASQCVVVSRCETSLTPLSQEGWVKLGSDDGLTDIALWTDDYIDVISPLVSGLRKRMSGPNNSSNNKSLRASSALGNVAL